MVLEAELALPIITGVTTCTLIDYRTNSTNSAFKGEGIYKNTNANFVNGIAKILNGGGGGGQDVNGGGAGGGNFTTGGLGGIGWNGTAAGCPIATSPRGLGGLSLSAQITANRVFMGGGGGGVKAFSCKTQTLVRLG